MGSNVNSYGVQVTSNTAFNTKYLIYDVNVIQSLKEFLCDKTFLNQIQRLFTNPNDFINSLKYYPLKADAFVQNSSYQILKIGNVPTTIGARKVNYISKSIRIASMRVNPKYNNFMDYDPYTKVELFVPYFSFLSLPTNEVMGKTIDLYLSIDFDTGMGTLYIQVEGRVIMTTSQKLGIDIPIGSSNLNEVVKDNIANAVKTTAGIAMMTYGGGSKMTGALLTAKGLSMAVTSGIDAVTNSVVRYTRGNMTGGSDMLGSPTSVFLVITRPNAVRIDSNYNRIKGKPLGDIRSLGSLNGFTQVDQIHIKNIPNALEEELNEIEQLLKTGVEL